MMVASAGAIDARKWAPKSATSETHRPELPERVGPLWRTIAPLKHESIVERCRARVGTGPVTFDQATVAGGAAITVAAGLLLWHWKRASEERASQRRRVMSGIKNGQLPTLPAPSVMNLSAKEVVHICAKAKGKQLDVERDLGDGLLVVSNRRICFFGERQLSLTWKKIDSTGVDPRDGVIVYAEDDRGYTFALSRGEDVEMIREVLHAVDDARSAGGVTR